MARFMLKYDYGAYVIPETVNQVITNQNSSFPRDYALPFLSIYSPYEEYGSKSVLCSRIVETEDTPSGHDIEYDMYNDILYIQMQGNGNYGRGVWNREWWDY